MPHCFNKKSSGDSRSFLNGEFIQNAQLMHMIQTVYCHRKQRVAQGKRLHVVDEYFFKDAEQILYNEFQYVLQLESKEALMDYILSRMEKRSE